MSDKLSNCQDCFTPGTQNSLYNVTINSQVGPIYSIYLCASCTKKRGKSPNKLETAKEFSSRMNKYLGLNK